MSIVLANADVWRVKLACMQLNQLGLNIIYYKIQTVVGAPTADGWSAQVDAAVGAFYAAGMSASGQYYGSSWERVQPGPSAPLQYNINSLFGSAGGSPLPAQASGIITKQTGTAGRKARGRMYVPFPSLVFQSTAEVPLVAYDTVLTALATYLFAPYTYTAGAASAGIIPVVCGRSGTPSYPITGFRVNPRWATQRRRGDYGRLNPPPW